MLGCGLNDTGEACKGLRTALILGTMSKLALNDRRSQSPLSEVVGWLDRRIEEKPQLPLTIMLQTDSVQ